MSSSRKSLWTPNETTPFTSSGSAVFTKKSSSWITRSTWNGKKSNSRSGLFTSRTMSSSTSDSPMWHPWRRTSTNSSAVYSISSSTLTLLPRSTRCSLVAISPFPLTTILKACSRSTAHQSTPRNPTKTTFPNQNPQKIGNRSQSPNTCRIGSSTTKRKIQSLPSSPRYSKWSLINNLMSIRRTKQEGRREWLCLSTLRKSSS